MATITAPAQQQQGNAKPALRKPVFVKVDQLKPGTSGHTLTVNVLNSNTVLQKGRSVSQHLRHTKVSECLVGDETGSILFTARNEQGSLSLSLVRVHSVAPCKSFGWKQSSSVDTMKPGTTVILRNAKIDMFKGSMRLAVDKWGRIEVTEPAQFAVKEDNNLSLVEYELVNVQE